MCPSSGQTDSSYACVQEVLLNNAKAKMESGISGYFCVPMCFKYTDFPGLMFHSSPQTRFALQKTYELNSFHTESIAGCCFYVRTA